MGRHSSYLSRRELAEVLHVSVATFDRMRASGVFDVEPRRWGGQRLYWLKSDVIRWIRGHEHGDD